MTYEVQADALKQNLRTVKHKDTFRIPQMAGQ